MRETRKITAVSILILLISQAFMILLASNAFERVHVASELSRYAVPQKDFKRKVEAGLRFGKPLDNLLGMESLIAEYAGKYTDLTNIAIYSTGRELLYSLHPLEEAPAPAEGDGKRIEAPDPLMEVEETEAAYVIVLPLFGPGETWMGTTAPASAWAGSVVFAFDKQSVREGVRLFWQQRLFLGMVIAGSASLLLFFLLFRVNGPDVKSLRRRIFLRVLGVIILAQVAFAGINAFQIHRDHVLLLKDRVHAQLDLLRIEVEQVLARGIGLDRVSRMDEFLMDILDNNPELESLTIRDGTGETTAQARKSGLAADVLQQDSGPTGFSVILPLRHLAGDTSPGEMRAELDKGAVRALILKILLDSLTVILIASLFIVEQIYFLVSRIGGRMAEVVGQASDAGPLSDQDVLDKLMLARFAAFAFVFAFALPVSFVPLQMRELYMPLWGLPRSVVLGLPISAEMLCALLSSLAAGVLADRRGWRVPFQVGVVVTSAGMLFCALAATGSQFILARGVCGLGYGLSWMALQSYLFSHSTPATRAQGSSHYVAGIFSGHICGTALGAMLAERIGYSAVFILGTALALGCLAFFFLFMRSVKSQARPIQPAQLTGPNRAQALSSSPSALVRPGAVAAYLRDRNTFLLIFCCIIPFSICQVGLLFFATPLYLNQMGISQSDIGRVLMIYGLSVVYLAPQLSKLVDRHERKVPFIVAGGLVGGLGLSLLYLHQGFVAVIASIFLLGLASSIGSSAQTAFALKLRSTRHLGTSKAMAIQRAADKLGQMLGPLALGALMSGMSISQGLVIIGLGYSAVSVLFLLLAREREPGLFSTIPNASGTPRHGQPA